MENLFLGVYIVIIINSVIGCKILEVFWVDIRILLGVVEIICIGEDFVSVWVFFVDIGVEFLIFDWSIGEIFIGIF